MEALHSLLHSLSRAQIRVLRNYLTSFSSRGEADAKTLHLTEILLRSSTDVPSIEQCSREIYGEPVGSRMLKLKSRLKSKVLDSLLLDINVERNDVFDELDQMTIKLKKKSAQFYVLNYSLSSHPYVKELIDGIIANSKQFENYSVLIELLRFKKFKKGFRQGEREFNKANKEIAFYESCNTAVLKAIDYYYRMSMMTSFKGGVEGKKGQKFLLDAIADLHKEYELTRSAVVSYYLKQLEFAYFSANKNFEAARNVCLEQLAVVNNHKSVYRRLRVGIAYDNIAQCDIFLEEYDKAIRNAQAAQKHFEKTSMNFYVSKEIEFYSLFYNKDLQRARSIGSLLLGNIKTKTGDFRYAKYRFFVAAILFQLGSYKETLKLVSEKLEVSKDKSGWEIAIRILIVLCQIELGSFDQASMLIDSLRKHIDRQGKVADIRERDRLIVKVLQMISKRGFAQGQVSEKEIELLRLLASDDKKYKWEALTPELIPFHQWVIKKYRISLTKATAPKAKLSRRKVLAN
jgi:tetratricopeptide (TPR) repeat protein